MTSLERYAEELKVAEIEFTSVDGEPAQAALKRVDEEHRTLSFSVNRGPSDSDQKNARLGFRFRAAQSQLAEAQARNAAAVANAEALARVDATSAAAIAADTAFGARVEEVLQRLAKEVAVVHGAAAAADAALSELPWPVRQQLNLSPPTVDWACLHDVPIAELAARLGRIVGGRAFVKSMADSTTIPNTNVLPDGPTGFRREIFRTLLPAKGGRREAESP
jgi:hypothetical protein